MILVKRVYDVPEASDGVRVLVDRLWPRGLSKASAQIDLWLKEIAPSDALRKWFNHEPEKWDRFKDDYFKELIEKKDAVLLLKRKAEHETVSLLYAAKDAERNNAVALREFLSGGV
ncbi:MAG: DUF488 domain-containing protein [Spirochaetota bacterium]